MKKSLLMLILSLLTFLPATAEKTAVEITPVEKITTSNDKFLEGDYVDFKVVGSDKLVRGLIVKYEENGFGGKEAVLVIDQFRAVNSNDKYSGTLSISGNQHNGAAAVLGLGEIGEYIRGGEVKIIPDKDIFTIWREE
ncbi:MAG: hypothetical protein NC390_02460 [Fusobacterium sp.]|nr:hypothetical protein [Fusobacterium sp.]